MTRPYDLGFMSKLRTIWGNNVSPWPIINFEGQKMKRNSQSNISENRTIRVDMAHTEEASNQIPNNIAVAQGKERASRAVPFNFEYYTLAQLAAATTGFAPEAKIGEGSFCTVYRGKLPDGREVAIKRRDSSGPMARKFEKEKGFHSELVFLSHIHHKHLVRFVGYCEENDERLLVYDYMKNGALYDHLHPKPAIGDESPPLVLSSWKLRIKILLDASRGIEFLHSFVVPPIIHRDIKSSNILLDDSWVARVSDFGLSLKASGTVGYMDPEFYGTNYLSLKSDVYGFGVVMLEALTGKRAIFKEALGGHPVNVVDYAQPSIVAGELEKVLDGRAPKPTPSEAEAVELVAYTAVHCVQLEGKDRPAMANIVANLETAFAVCERHT